MKVNTYNLKTKKCMTEKCKHGSRKCSNLKVSHEIKDTVSSICHVKRSIQELAFSAMGFPWV